MAPRFPTSGTILRPTIDAFGDRAVSAVVASGVLMAVWDRRMKTVQAEGELVNVTAIAFVPSGTDVQTRDVISGVAALPGRQFEVLAIVSGMDDRGRLDHIGLELRGVPY